MSLFDGNGKTNRRGLLDIDLLAKAQARRKICSDRVPTVEGAPGGEAPRRPATFSTIRKAFREFSVISLADRRRCADGPPPLLIAEGPPQ